MSCGSRGFYEAVTCGYKQKPGSAIELQIRACAVHSESGNTYSGSGTVTGMVMPLRTFGNRTRVGLTFPLDVDTNLTPSPFRQALNAVKIRNRCSLIRSPSAPLDCGLFRAYASRSNNWWIGSSGLSGSKSWTFSRVKNSYALA